MQEIEGFNEGMKNMQMDYYIEVMVDNETKKDKEFLNKLVEHFEKKPEKIAYIKPYDNSVNRLYKPILLIYNKEIEGEIENLKQKHNL